MCFFIGESASLLLVVKDDALSAIDALAFTLSNDIVESTCQHIAHKMTRSP